MLGQFLPEQLRRGTGDLEQPRLEHIRQPQQGVEPVLADNLAPRPPGIPSRPIGMGARPRPRDPAQRLRREVSDENLVGRIVDGVLVVPTEG